MIAKPIRIFAIFALVGVLAAGPLNAGGRLETADITSGVQTFFPFFDGVLIPIGWDVRCIPVQFTLDTTPPNPPGPDFISVATVQAELQASLDRWNNIPTSFINMQIPATAPLGNPTGAFDFINEVNFVAVGSFLAAAPSVSLIRDTTLVAGQNIDAFLGDQDPDVFDPVAVGVNQCHDFDGDGDIDFPAGFYRAGTILDNDVFFNGAITWTVGPPDAVTNRVDIQAVAVHEFGHSHGLSHTTLNQISAADGTGTTMFPFIDTGDPAAELSQRTPEVDDAAWSSFAYPEGTAGSGPPALQAGDVPFSSVYGLITGEVRHGGQGGAPLAGASVFAVDKNSGNVVAEGFSGTTQVGVFDFVGSGTDFTSGFFLVGGQGFHILDGRYTIPVPKGNYEIGVHALDGQPAGTGNISITAILGGIFGQNNFQEEFYGKSQESALETQPGYAHPVSVNPGQVRSGIDVTTNITQNLTKSGNREFIGFTGSPGGRLYAVRIPNSQALAALNAGATIHTGIFNTTVVDASVAPLFAQAQLTTGTVSGSTASINLAQPLRSQSTFLGQDNDFTPFYFNGPVGLSSSVANLLAGNPSLDLFLVLELPPAPFPGVSGIPPLIGLDANGPFGCSYISDDGGATFTQVNTFNFMFELVTTP